MILLQVFMVPGFILLLLISIFLIGSTGIEQPESSDQTVQDDAWIDERLSAVTAGFIRKPCEPQSNGSSKDQINLRPPEISHTYSICDSLSEQPICEQ